MVVAGARATLELREQPACIRPLRVAASAVLDSTPVSGRFGKVMSTTGDAWMGRRTLRKIVVALAGGFAAASFLTWWVLEVYFAGTSPRVPDLGAGKTFSINVHGTVVYLTHCEYFLAGPPMIWISFYSILLLALLLALLGDPFPRKH